MSLVLSRRELLLRAAAFMATASQPRTPINFDVPAGACDCHTHIFGDPQRFPMTPSRVYTPEQASVDEMRTLHRALHVDRVVIVQPSIYGTDNACTLDAVKQLGSRARAIAVIDVQTAVSDTMLAGMDAAGVRGIRLNLETSGIADPSVGSQRVRAALDRLRGSRWHIQMNTRLSMIDAVRDQVAAAPVRFVFDHFGGAQASLGLDQPGFKSLLELVRGGFAYVKISGGYRSSSNGPNYPDVAPFAKALIAANPQRILWGTDWPHPDSAIVAGRKNTDIAPLLQIDDGALCNQLAVWAPDAAVRTRILVRNPAELYGF
jgi:predicted TIM-barrel fold metal-dependent hydrolase